MRPPVSVFPVLRPVLRLAPELAPELQFGSSCETGCRRLVPAAPLG